MRLGASILVAAFVVFGAALLVPDGPRVLTAAEASQHVGGVELFGFRCQAVATCDTFNQYAGSVVTCPSGSGICAFCSNGDKTLTNCVRSTGNTCNWRPPSRGNCGVLQIGGCEGTSCVFTFTQ